jgi:DNA mismatch endonuclease, patch repair protein
MSEEWNTDVETSLRLSRMAKRNTRPELLVRRAVHDLGHRYRISVRDLPGSPDIANKRRRWAIFVHGCFWHAHPGCPRATLPKRNRQMWHKKLQANRMRDQRNEDACRAMGLNVLVVWECETKDVDALRERLRAWFGEASSE